MRPVPVRNDVPVAVPVAVLVSVGGNLIVPIAVGKVLQVMIVEGLLLTEGYR